MNKAGGYWIGFFSTHSSSIWKKHLTNTKQVIIKLFIHKHFKWVENHHHFSHFSISHQTYTTNFTLDYYSSITQNLTWWLSTIHGNDLWNLIWTLRPRLLASFSSFHTTGMIFQKNVDHFTQYQFTEKSHFWVLKNLTTSTLMWKKIVRPLLSVGFLPLHEMGQLVGMQAPIQLHQMAWNSIIKNFAFWLLIWNLDALNTLKFFGAMNSLQFFCAMNSLQLFGAMNGLQFFGALNSDSHQFCLIKI